jgi:hypothetical protein
MATCQATHPGQSLYPIVSGAAHTGRTPFMANNKRPKIAPKALLRLIAISWVAYYEVANP